MEQGEVSLDESLALFEEGMPCSGPVRVPQPAAGFD